MASAGYVYVLINPSIPGCVKIGKSMRDPSVRAAELSAATGVATPFMVAYEAHFNDCDYAEQYIHALLERAGVRLSSNREFFTMSAPDAVNVVIRAKLEIDKFAEGRGKPLPGDSNGELDSNLAPWEEVFNEAMDYYFGEDGKLEDHKRAIELFKMAAKLGAGEAYLYLGRLIGGDQGLEWLKRGAEKGVAKCWLELADAFEGESIYFETTQKHQENEFKALCNFFEVVNPIEFDRSGNRLWALLQRCLRLRKDVHADTPRIDETLRNFVERFRSMLDLLEDSKDRAAKLKALNEFWPE